MTDKRFIPVFKDDELELYWKVIQKNSTFCSREEALVQKDHAGETAKYLIVLQYFPLEG